MCLKDCILVSSGGGGSRVGLKNSIVCDFDFGSAAKKQLFPLSPTLKEPFFTLDLADDIVERLRYNMDCDLLVGNASEHCVVYQYNAKALFERVRFRSDFKTKDPYQVYFAALTKKNDAVINGKGTMIATGGDEGVVRLWSYADGEATMEHEFIEDASPITSLDFHKT